MFKKPFRVKSQTATKGSERKKLRQEIGRQYAHLDEQCLTTIIPNKDDLQTMKIYTHSGETVLVYILNKSPAFFELDNHRIYPTVYTLWKHPDLLPAFPTGPLVFSKLEGGADLMLPGVFLPGEITSDSLHNLDKAVLCYIKLCGSKSAVAVGKTACSSAEMVESGMRGKGVLIMHTLHDHIWEHGDKSEPPYIEDTLYNSPVSPPGEDHSRCSEDGTISPGCAENPDDATSGSGGVDDIVEQTGDLCIKGSSREGSVSPESDASSSGVGVTQDDMDELLMWCFKCAVKFKVTKRDLPLLTSKFSRVHLQACCPPQKQLDIKSSSYKKLGKFLHDMQLQGFIALQETSKGVDSITDIHKDHSELREFTVSEADLPAVDEIVETCRYEPPQVTVVYMINTQTLPLFSPQGHGKGAVLTPAAVRQVIVEYVKREGLQHAERKDFVTLDGVLSDAALPKGDYREVLRWPDLCAAVQAKMTLAYEIGFAGKPPEVCKGSLDPIHFTIKTVMGKKKITLLDNLAAYGIDPHNFAHDVQVALSVSTHVAQHPAQKAGHLQVTVQGNQVNYCAQLLADKYKLPRKFLSGLDSAPKKKK